MTDSAKSVASQSTMMLRTAASDSKDTHRHATSHASSLHQVLLALLVGLSVPLTCASLSLLDGGSPRRLGGAAQIYAQHGTATNGLTVSITAPSSRDPRSQLPLTPRGASQDRPAASESSRRDWLRHAISSSALLLATSPHPAAAENPPTPVASPKESPPPAMTDEQLRQVVTSDLVDRQFLVTGNLTPSVYLPSATFTDEIDTYGFQQWREGTQKLFVGEGSQVRLVGNVHVTPKSVEFRFDEDLMFRVPFRPVVSLSGKVVLMRDPTTGLIASYREYWDQDVATVLKSAKIKF